MSTNGFGEQAVEFHLVAHRDVPLLEDLSAMKQEAISYCCRVLVRVDFVVEVDVSATESGHAPLRCCTAQHI